ncbi:MAG: cytochrome C [Planctomycetes bacterium]|nr:cytochrome C [Planctomycetota bacterium]
MSVKRETLVSITTPAMVLGLAVLLLLLLGRAASAEEGETPKPKEDEKTAPADDDLLDAKKPAPAEAAPGDAPKDGEKPAGDGGKDEGAKEGEDLLEGGADLLRRLKKARESKAIYDEKKPGVDPHVEIFAKANFPSATECANCHQQIYDEWRSSAHAYASISPMFHKFEQAINDFSQGTVGHFCVQCHATVGTAMGEPRWAPLWKRAQVSREGVTCVTCHRVNIPYGKVNGARYVIRGDIFQPVYGGQPGDGVDEVVKNKDKYKVATDTNEKGVRIHKQGIQFEYIGTSDFCVSCHQVALDPGPGIKLEVVWDQYRASPARREGIRCQDCHMGHTPGVAHGFATGPIAVIGDQKIKPDAKHSNHGFYGPGYPIAHPGIFPHHKDAGKFSIESWMRFNYRDKWGSKDFEAKVKAGEAKVEFPQEWSSVDDRIEAWEIVESNLAKMEERRRLRIQVMENGSKLVGPLFKKDAPTAGKDLKFTYEVHNTDKGHNLPSGSLGAQPEIWLNVALTDPDGKNIWESGYVDSHGDMCDLHSLDVRANKMPHDAQLFNLQTKFLIQNVKGTDREMYLPVNLDNDQLFFVRPQPQPTSVLNHPFGARMEQRSIPPLSKKNADYEVPGKLLKKPGKYRLSARLRSRAEPIYFMKFCGATSEMERAMNEWMIDIHPYTVEFEVKAKP